MSDSVARRRNEIGIRVALGAEQMRVLGMALSEVGVLILIGLAVGFGATLAVTWFESSLLYGVKPNDPFALFLATAASGVGAFRRVLAGATGFEKLTS